VSRIAHGEQSIDRAVLVASYRVDDRVPASHRMSTWKGRGRVCWHDDEGSQEGRIVIRKDRVERGNLGIRELVDPRAF
jgi:hypothetical protein